MKKKEIKAKEVGEIEAFSKFRIVYTLFLI